MGSTNKSNSPSIAYLVIRDGNKWSDVFRLVPGRTVTIGRSPTNQIVIKEEQASRQHAEIFLNDGQWTVRDLKSRNGTAVGENRVTGDFALSPGDVIWIANTQMAFVHDLTSAYDRKIFSRVEIGPETITGLEVDEEPTMSEIPMEPATITHRRQKTRYFAEDDNEDAESDQKIPKVGLAATKLCRLAFELNNETTARGIARLTLDGLVNHTHVDAGAMLMIPKSHPRTVDPQKLEIIGWRSEHLPEYQRVSKFLAETVLRSGEAVLARDIQDDSALGLRDSNGEIQANSVICAPVRVNGRNTGLIHLYSTKPKVLLDPDDLEFSLAVAEMVGWALRNKFRERKLVDDLTKRQSEIDQLRQKLGVESEIVGGSPAMLKVHQQIARSAPH